LGLCHLFFFILLDFGYKKQTKDMRYICFVAKDRENGYLWSFFWEKFIRSEHVEKVIIMLTPKKFYENLWKGKKSGQLPPLQSRDWFHRIFLDWFFNPLENPRYDVALQLLKPGARLLDIGCWDGRLLELIRHADLFSELYGVDLPFKAVECVKLKGFNAQVVDLNGEPLPFQDEYFDAVMLLAVLEHIFDPYAVIREIHRVLRPGGTLIIDIPNVASFTNRTRILFGRLPVTSADPGWDGGHLHYFTKYALDQFLLSEGFQITARKSTGGRPYLREWWLSLLAGELIYSCSKS
jgi:methionine biosynthesis protein MetW